MITKLKETLGIIKANPIKCGFIILITIYLLTLCLNFDIADWFNLTAKTSDKCSYLAKEQLIIKTQNINKSQNLTTIIDINNNCNSSNSEKQIIAKRDLTKLGSFLMMGLIGIIVASVVNMFLKSSMMDFVISILGVLIFVGLTAYDTQKIKNMYVSSDTGELMGKKAVMGALTLYLDFINLFIMLLRLFGQRR